MLLRKGCIKTGHCQYLGISIIDMKQINKQYKAAPVTILVGSGETFFLYVKYCLQGIPGDRQFKINWARNYGEELSKSINEKPDLSIIYINDGEFWEAHLKQDEFVKSLCKSDSPLIAVNGFWPESFSIDDALSMGVQKAFYAPVTRNELVNAISDIVSNSISDDF